jgi:hypothetical protein
MKKLILCLLFIPCVCFGSYRLERTENGDYIWFDDNNRIFIGGSEYIKVEKHPIHIEQDWKDIEHIITQIKGKCYDEDISDLKDKIDLLEMKILKLESQKKDK